MPVKGYRGSHHLVTAREYERALFNQLYYVFRRPHYIVVPDQRALRGLLSRARRQTDVSVYRSGQPRPAIAVECKRYGRRLNIKDVESFLGMLEDLGAQRGVLVAPLGYSRAAERRVHGTGVDLHRLAERDAVRLNWRELARAVFPWDEGFHREMADAFDAVMVNSDMERAADALEAVAFEEWEAAILAIFSRMPDRPQHYYVASRRPTLTTAGDTMLSASSTNVGNWMPPSLLNLGLAKTIPRRWSCLTRSSMHPRRGAKSGLAWSASVALCAA